MVHVHHTGIAATPLDFAFDYVSDFRNFPEWMFGIEYLRPVGEIAQGNGAVFEGAMKLGVTLHSTIEITEWKPNCLLRTESRSGFVNRSSWRFLGIDERTTELAVDIEYELPGGLAGKALGRVIEPFVVVALRHSDHTLRTALESRFGGRSEVAG
ncbi:SRPBCC family protein [Nocardia sp. NPDC004722]